MVAPRIDAAQLYERYREQIYRYCLGRLRNREEAADAAQNTFLRMHVALERGVVPQYEAAWLYKIARNACLSWIESSGRRALVETPRDLESLDEAVLAAPASEHEAIEELAEALAALPPNLRQAFLLREWHGLNYAEIAAAMNTTVPAVETLLVRARRQLRRAVAGALDVLGLRGLLSGVTGKVAIGAALVAVGGSGIGVSVALSDRPTARPHRVAPLTRPAVAAHARPVPAAAPARRPSKHRSAVRSVRHPAPAPAVWHASTPRPSPAAASVPTRGAVAAVAAPAPAPLTAATTATAASPAPVPAPGSALALTVPSLTTAPPPLLSTTTLAALPSLPPLPQAGDTAPAPQLPVTTPALTVPAVALP